MDKNQNEAQGQAELELNDDQIARNDEICNAVFELCKVLTENQELEWDMEYIGGYCRLCFKCTNTLWDEG